MGRGKFGAILLFSVLIAGCFGEPIVNWGDDNGEFETTWDSNPENLVNVSSKISDETVQMELTAQGCDDDGGELKAGSTGEVTQEVRVSGWLISSKHFTEGVKGQPSQQVIPSSVLIALDDFDTAKEKTFEDYDKLTVKEWDTPTALTTMPKLDSATLTHTKYGIVGLIPANENILDGFAALNDWHQPIELVGYAVNTNNPTNGVMVGEWTVGEDCRAITLAANGISMVVTSVNLDNNAISMDGKAKSEWSKGDIPFIGTYLYMLLVLIAGGGGAFLLFTFSMGMERHGAKAAARSMLTDAQMKMAKVVRKDVKKAKKDGLDMSAGSMIGNDEKKEEKNKVTQKLDEFDVESVLSSIGEGRGQGAELGGGGVVLTDDAYDMGDQLQESIDSGGVNLGESTERIGHTLAFDIDDILNPQAEEEEYYEGGFTTPQRSSSPPKERRSMSGRQSASSEDNQNEPAERGPPKRRSVRKTKPRSDSQDSSRKSPPVRKTPEKRTSVNDDEDFSDFSF
ncbi:MAG: hypothetical protein VX277_04145 [Candidatus Thermoplasmatota archaeon]|nr:hypothetical protein [Candidatus Thermoplasmatota archaeon]